MLVGFGVKIFQALAGCFLMAAQIVIGTVCNAPQLAPVGERESVLDIGGGAAVESQLGRRRFSLLMPKDSSHFSQ